MPQMNIRVDPDMFGASIGRSIQGFGQELRQASDTLFNNAMQMKHDAEDANVNKAVTASLMATGELDNKFRLLQGEDAQKSLDNHVKALDETRVSIRDSQLTSAREKKIFDRETMRRFGYDVVNASNWAAGQSKKAAAEASKASRAAIADGILRDPFNDKFIDFTVDGLAGKIASDPDNQGDDKATIDLKVRSEIGMTIARAAAERSKTDPDRAKHLLERYRPIMGEAAYEKALDTVNDRASDLYARRAAREITGESSKLIDERKANYNIRTESLTPDFRTRLNAAIKVAEERTGDRAQINSATRTTAEQVNLFERYRLGIGGRAAPPGTSRHEIGEAVDLAEGKVLKELRNMWASGELNKYGLEFLKDRNGKPIMDDTGHIQLARDVQPDASLLDQSATKVAGSTEFQSPEARYINNMKTLEEMANKLYPDPKDAPWKEKFLERGMGNIQRNSSIQLRALNDQIKFNRNGIDNVLYSVDKQTGVGPRSLDEATKIDPHFQARVEEAQKLDPTITKRVNDAFASNARQDVPQTKERYDRWQAARGAIASARAGLTDVNEVLQMSPASLDLPRAWQTDIKTKLDALQQHANKTGTDLKMRSYIADVTSLLNAEGIYANDKETWNQFVGAYMTRIEDFKTDNNGKLPSYDERQRMASTLIRDGGFWHRLTGGLRPFEVPSGFFTDAMRKEFVTQFGEEPSKADIYKLYRLHKKRLENRGG